MITLRPLHIAGILAVAAVFFWLSRAGTLLVSPHGKEDQCHLCHPGDPRTSPETSVISNIDLTCIECHPMEGALSHPTGVLTDIAVPSEFPLDARGRLTCGSCHEVHQPVTTENPPLLRTDYRGERFCNQCHPLDVSGDWNHAGVGGIAHGGSEPSESERVGMILDSHSLECLMCHDGVTAQEITPKLPGGEMYRSGGTDHSHPVGGNYRDAMLKDRHLHPPEGFPQGMILPDGNMSCLSCHNPYSKERWMTVISNRGSALCLKCHDH